MVYATHGLIVVHAGDDLFDEADEDGGGGGGGGVGGVGDDDGVGCTEVSSPVLARILARVVLVDWQEVDPVTYDGSEASEEYTNLAPPRPP